MESYMINSRRKKRFPGGLSINTLIILLNVILFIVFILLVNYNVLTWEHIAIKPANIVQGKYVWTFLTSMFMHGGFFHLFVNMLSLFFVGTLLQRILGAKRYLHFYLIAGLLASLFFVLVGWGMFQLGFPKDFNALAVGASGALFGLIGVLVLLTPNLPVYVMFIPIPIKIKYAAPGILVLLWLISYFADVPIGNTAHLGGLLCGLGYGIYLRYKYKNKIRAISRQFS